jgi:hypothetical protein
MVGRAWKHGDPANGKQGESKTNLGFPELNQAVPCRDTTNAAKDWEP